MLSQRANLFLGGPNAGPVAEFRYDSAAKSSPAVSINFWNVGRSAASHFGINVSTSVASRPSEVLHLRRYWLSKKGATLILRNRGDSTIGEGSPRSEYLAPALSPSPQQLTDIRAGRLPFYVDGTFEHCDEFGTFRCEQFELRYSPSPIDGFEVTIDTGVVS